MPESPSDRTVVPSKSEERPRSVRLYSKAFEKCMERAFGKVLRYLDKENPQLIDGKLAIDEASAAAYLGLNSWQLRDLRRDGKITYRRIVGNRVRYTLEDLKKYLEQSIQSGT